jgi:hypoxia up-regulated 1
MLTDESFIQYSNDDQRGALETLLKSTSEWLYEDGSTSTSEILKSKLKDLKALVNPVQRRRKEAQDRPEKIEMLKQALSSAQSLVTMMKDSMADAAKLAAESSSSAAAAAAASSSSEAAKSASDSTGSSDAPEASKSAESSSEDPLAELEEDEPSTKTTTEAATPSPEPWTPQYTEEDLLQITKAYEEANTWMEEKLAAQEKLPLYEDPVVSSKELMKKADELNNALIQIFQVKMKMPKATRSKTSKATKATKKPKPKTKTKKESEKAEETPVEVVPEKEPVTVVEDATPSNKPDIKDEL